MRRLFLILGNDVRRHLKAPLVVVIFIAIPLVMTGLIGVVFGPRTEDTQLPPIILLVDHAGLVSEISAGRLRRRPAEEDVPGDRDRRS
jgi:hypothetical protein